jgi:hypothetical protein
MCILDVRFTVECVFDVIFEFLTLKMTSKTHYTVKRTSKLHIQNAGVIDPLHEILAIPCLLFFKQLPDEPELNKFSARSGNLDARQPLLRCLLMLLQSHDLLLFGKETCMKKNILSKEQASKELSKLTSWLSKQKESDS